MVLIRADFACAGSHLYAVTAAEHEIGIKSLDSRQQRGRVVQGAEWVDHDIKARASHFFAY